MTTSTTTTTSKTRRGGKRGNSEGRVAQLSDGRWQARVMLEGGQCKAFHGKTRQKV